MDVASADPATNRKRTYGSPDGPAAIGSPENGTYLSDDNPFGIPSAPPYKLHFEKGKSFQSVVQRADTEMLAKMISVVIYCYRLAKTMPIYILYDAIDKSYQVTFMLPFDAIVGLNTLVSIYRVNPMLITQKAWSQVTQTPDPSTGEMVPNQTVTVGVASYKRSHVVVTDTCLMQYESEATQRSPEDFAEMDMRRVDTAPVAPVRTTSRRPPPIPSLAQGDTPAGEGMLPPGTPTNELRVPQTTQPYRIIVPPRMTFADVVAVPDLDMLRKIAQVVFYFYTTPKTINVCVSYDLNDRAYEVTFVCPREARISQDFLASIYCICPMLVTAKPYISAARSAHPTTGEIVVTQNVSLRFASYRRPCVTIPDTGLLMWNTQSTYVPSEEESDIVRPTPRQFTFQYGKGDNTPAGPGAVGKL